MAFNLIIQNFIKAHYVFIHNYGYLTVFLLIMLEDFGIPSPGEITLISVSLIASEGAEYRFSAAIFMVRRGHRG